MSKFKVGDRVRLLTNGEYRIYIPGTEHEVVFVDDYLIYIPYPGKSAPWIRHDTCLAFYPHDLELVVEEPTTNSIDDGGPAFPQPVGTRRISAQEVAFDCTTGMSLRDHFAGLALAALIAKHPPGTHVDNDWRDDDDHIVFRNARGAYDYADAMLMVRSKSNDW